MMTRRERRRRYRRISDLLITASIVIGSISISSAILMILLHQLQLI